MAAAGLGATTVKWQSFSAGPMMNEAIASGQLDIIFTGDLPAIIGKSIGFETHVIGIASSGYLSQAGVVLANSSIKSVKDLKGKKVATFKGTIAHHLLILALKEANMKLSDIELVNLTLPDMNNALQRGDVAAAFLWEPLLSQLELDHSVRVIRDGKGLKNAIAVILATDDYVAKHRAESQVVLKAFKRGAELIKRHPAEATKLVAAELNQPLPIIRRSLDKFMTGLRTGLTISWMCVVAAELIAASSGVGFLIMDARQLSQSDVVLAGMASIGILGKVSDDLLQRLENRMMSWRTAFSGN